MANLKKPTHFLRALKLPIVILVSALVLFEFSLLVFPGLKECIRDYQYKTAEVGSLVKFGNYEQDANLDNGPEEIKWVVLAREDNKILVISKDALLASKYLDIPFSYRQANIDPDLVPWKDCVPRQILNEKFYFQAFTEKEQERIALTTVISDIDTSDKTIDPATDDHIFILSESEVKIYFQNLSEYS